MNNEGISRLSYNLLPFSLSLFLALSLHSLFLGGSIPSKHPFIPINMVEPYYLVQNLCMVLTHSQKDLLKRMEIKLVGKEATDARFSNLRWR